jgi:hypothetical protein
VGFRDRKAWKEHIGLLNFLINDDHQDRFRKLDIHLIFFLSSLQREILVELLLFLMKVAFLAFSLIFLQSSCTNRASSKFSGTSNPSPSWNVILTENNTIEEEYYTLGKIKATVKKNLLFFPNPTKKQVDEELIHKARLIGADAVIQLQYSGGVGFTTWSYMEAKGIAVKFTKPK